MTGHPNFSEKIFLLLVTILSSCWNALEARVREKTMTQQVMAAESVNVVQHLCLSFVCIS